MTSYDDATPEVRTLVDDLQAEIRNAVRMIGETVAIAEGEPMFWADGSAGAIAFDAGVEAGMAATMSVLMRRGWLNAPDGGQS